MNLFVILPPITKKGGKKAKISMYHHKLLSRRRAKGPLNLKLSFCEVNFFMNVQKIDLTRFPERTLASKKWDE